MDQDGNKNDGNKKDFNERSRILRDDPRKRMEHFVKQRQAKLTPKGEEPPEEPTKPEKPAKPKEDLKAREEYFRKRRGNSGPKK